MFRAFVLLLMLPTMLMPPGMCVCRFVPVGKSSAGQFSSPAVGSSHATQAASASSDCACDSCRLRASENGPARSNNGPVHSPSGPAPSKHWPGCPAEIDAAPLTLVITGVEAQADLFATDVDLTTLATQVFSLPRVASFPSPVVPPPLFISLCTLRI